MTLLLTHFLTFVHKQGTTSQTSCSTESYVPAIVTLLLWWSWTIATLLLGISRSAIAALGELVGSLTSLSVYEYPSVLVLVPFGYPGLGRMRSAVIVGLLTIGLLLAVLTLLLTTRGLTLVGKLVDHVIKETHFGLIWSASLCRGNGR